MTYVQIWHFILFNKIRFIQEYEEPTDPFQNHRRRFQNELDRYLANVNLDFKPPMPKPKYATNQYCDISRASKTSNLINKTLNENQSNPLTSINYSSNYPKLPSGESYGNNAMTRSTEFEYESPNQASRKYTKIYEME